MVKSVTDGGVAVDDHVIPTGRGALSPDGEAAAAMTDDDTTDDRIAQSEEAASEEGGDSPEPSEKRKDVKTAQRRVTVSVRALVVGTLFALLLAGVAALGWLYFGEHSKLNALTTAAANNNRAEQIALNYAVDAAKIDAKDLRPWKSDLVKGTTPELKAKLDSASTSMEQILVPLQWNSSAQPLVAKVRSSANGIYVVDTFVSVQTKTVQAPDGLQSTATYSVTIDSNHDWLISEVGGVGAVVGQK